MCRIAGIVSKEITIPELTQHLKNMCNSMKKGGPDDFGYVIDENNFIGLGNRRLAILDITDAGHQPMKSDDLNVTITYNGEIYNFQLLKEELLSLGYTFKTKTDTEVIIKAYQCWGESSFNKLNGMFAFCIHDKIKNIIYLVRDPGGIKPLYYTINSKCFSFASEVKAFNKNGYPQSENEEWKIYYLAFGHIPEPYTTLKNVFSLQKGSFLKYNLNEGTFKINRFQEFKTTIEITKEKDAIEKIREELNTAIQSQLITDSTMGVLFSGGLDSSILKVLANKYSNEHIMSISANFDEIDFSESSHRKLITKGIATNYHEKLITYKDFVNNFENILQDMDQPTNDGINTWFICKSAKEQGLKSVLSGLGADELFGGYPSFDRIKTIQNLSKISRAAIKSARFLKNIRLKRLYYLSFESPIGEYLCLRGIYTPHDIAEILNIDVITVINCLQNIPINESIVSLNDEERASWFEMNMYLQNQLLKDIDFMSMSHGVEVRVPFLDVNFINTVNSIHPSIRYDKLQKKKLLIEAYKNDLPKETWDRSKMGFTFPFQEWMRKNKEISSADLYENKRAKKLMTSFNENNLHWSSAFALYKIFHAS